MTPTPKRHAIQLPTHGIAAAIARYDLDRIDLGAAQLKLDMRWHGWTARVPDDDRSDLRPRDPDDINPPIDYSDPTGEHALALGRMHEHLCEIQDLQYTLARTLARLDALTVGYVPTTTAEPTCRRTGCTNTVERTGDGRGFRGCKQVAGIWAARPGEKPICGQHRKDDERRAKAEERARRERDDQIERERLDAEAERQKLAS